MKGVEQISRQTLDGNPGVPSQMSAFQLVSLGPLTRACSRTKWPLRAHFAADAGRYAAR